MTRLLAATLLVTAITACSGDPSAVTCGGKGDGPQAGATMITPEVAREMSIADFLGTEERFESFHDLVSRTVSSGLDRSWLEIWDFPGSNMGDNRDGVTVFVPTDSAFDGLDPALLAAIRDPELENEIRYNLLGHHYVHRLYPESEFEAGPQRTWRGSGSVEMTLDPPTWGGCPIVETDIRVSNGYIHVVDGVVIPAELREAAGD